MGLGNPRGRSRNHNIEMENPEEESNFVKGGTLIVCPMALLGQWKDELETHSRPGSISVFIHYGCDRTNDRLRPLLMTTQYQVNTINLRLWAAKPNCQYDMLVKAQHFVITYKP
ncbi:transcription termination factor 2-like [Asparagus officinalis]|uniref:transcription termination factor 2-like n=1 Tax=Asparagus officinalis TaxID=4686 RepID=UPI00098E5E09|nr:transcription termination factor 2-like [Asparagus officinalis]